MESLYMDKRGRRNELVYSTYHTSQTPEVLPERTGVIVTFEEETGSYNLALNITTGLSKATGQKTTDTQNSIRTENYKTPRPSLLFR